MLLFMWPYAMGWSMYSIRSMQDCRIHSWTVYSPSLVLLQGWLLVLPKTLASLCCSDSLNWLQMLGSVKYKFSVIFFKVLHGTALAYISQLCITIIHINFDICHWQANRTETHIKSSVRRASVCHSWTSYNSLPAETRLLNCFTTFKSKLKTSF